MEGGLVPAKRIAVALCAVLIVGLQAPAMACSEVVGIRLSDCEEPPPQPTKPQRASVSARAEQALLAAANRARAARGLPALRLSDEASAFARAHARRMAAAGTAFHSDGVSHSVGNPGLGAPAGAAENVGHGPSANSIHRAFMRSPGHRRNILGYSFRRAGIAVVREGKSFYAVELFLTEATVRSWAPAGAARAIDPARSRTVAHLSRLTSPPSTALVGTTSPDGLEEHPWRWLGLVAAVASVGSFGATLGRVRRRRPVAG